jgi:uncharacterized protein YlxP (DUF503 family)
VYVGIAKLSLVIAQSTSLKDKRMVIRRVKDRVRERIGVVVNEVGALDDRQRAELGCAVASGDRAKALEVIDQVVRVAQAASDGQVVAIAKDAWTFEAEVAPLPVVDDRSGSGDKAAGMDDWIPEGWLDDGKAEE